MSEESNIKNAVTQSGFAKLCGVSPEAVRKAIVAGKIDAVGEGRQKRILLAGVNTIGYLNDRNSQRKNSAQSQPAAAPAAVSIPEKNHQNRQPIHQNQNHDLQSISTTFLILKMKISTCQILIKTTLKNCRF